MKKIAIFILLIIQCYAFAQDSPILTIEPGGHTAMVRGLIFTGDGLQLISAGDDKVVRIWDTGTGELIRSLRGQIGAGHEGKIFAIALSPDGGTLAVGGYDTTAQYGGITTFDMGSGAIRGVLRGHTNVIHTLAFSPDGRWLASGSLDKTIKLWDMSSFKLYRTLTGHQNRISGVSFSPDSKRLVSASNDRTLRLWGVTDGRLIREMTGHSAEVGCVSYSPDGEYIASGSLDNTIRLWDGFSGESIKVLGSHNNYVNTVSFSPDSQRLVSASGGATGGDFRAIVWRVQSGEALRTFSRHDNTVVASAFSPDGKVVASAGGNSYDMYLWDAGTGEVKRQIVGVGKQVWSIAFSKDGTQFAYGNIGISPLTWNSGKLEGRFDLMGMTLAGDVAPEDKSWRRAVTEHSGLSLKGQVEYELSILKGDSIQRTIKQSIAYDMIRCYSFTPSGDIVIGSEFTLALYDISGTQKKKFIGHTGVIWSLAVSPDGRYLISGSGDQTARLWNISTGELLASFFIASNNEWVAWAPSGYYKSSAGGDRLIGWHVNKGEDKSADYYYAYQFRKTFNRPDVFEYILTAGSVKDAIASANAEQPKQQQVFSINNIRKMEPPRVTIIEPTDNSAFDKPEITIKARVTSDTEITEITIAVNGRPAWKNDKGMMRRTSGTKTESIEQTVTLEPGKNTISMTARNENAVSQPVIVNVTYNKPYIQKPNLYILAIGVSKHKDSYYNLMFADKDAQTIADIFRGQAGKLFGTVTPKVLVNEQATRDNIADGLDWLLKESTQKDVSAIFISGHGMKDDQGNYYFFTHNGDDNSLRRTCVNWSDFENTLSSLPAKALFFVDTCKAGSVTGRAGSATGRGKKGSADITQIIADLASDELGVVVFASSTGKETSQEHSAWGHGAFTLALKEGLSGKADYDGNGAIYITEIDNYITARVKELTDGQQHPTTQKPTTVRSFPLVMVK